MLRSLYAMLDYHLDASDGVQGSVQDFLFDDESWVVHYLAAETPSPSGRRTVLILPFVLGHPNRELRRVPVSLTSEQIRTSPALESDLPVSQQREYGSRLPSTHLRSFREVLGYTVQAADGEAGTIEDCVIEDILWGVHRIVVSMKQPSHRSILLPPDAVDSISWSGKSVQVNLTREDLFRHPEFDPAQPVSRGSGRRLYDPLQSPPQTRARVQKS
jgi:hypothetical protein